jgi:hypothetical protein
MFSVRSSPRVVNFSIRGAFRASGHASFYSTAPRKSWTAIHTPLQLLWHNRVAMSYKYFGLIGLGGFIVTHTHPDVIVTVGPPLILGGYWAYTRYQRYLYARETAKLTGTTTKVKPDQEISSLGSNSPSVPKSSLVRILPYDESQLSNVLLSLENQFDHFKHQIVDLVERRIINYIVASRADGTVVPLSLLFIDENDQFNVNISENDVETFILLRVGKVSEDASQGSENSTPASGDLAPEIPFIKMSLPFYSDSLLRKRLGVIEVYLLEQPSENKNYTEYSMGIEISPYKFVVSSSDKLFITSVGDGVMTSRLLDDEEKKGNEGKKKENYEEFTINF